MKCYLPSLLTHPSWWATPSCYSNSKQSIIHSFILARGYCGTKSSDWNLLRFKLMPLAFLYEGFKRKMQFLYESIWHFTHEWSSQRTFLLYEWERERVRHEVEIKETQLKTSDMKTLRLRQSNFYSGGKMTATGRTWICFHRFKSKQALVSNLLEWPIW